MKKIVLTLSSLVLSVTLFAFAANASTKTRLTVDVPFDFSVGEKTITAGQYSVEVTRDSSGGATVGLIDSKGNRVALAIGRVESQIGGRTDFLFKKTGDEHVLNRIIFRDHAINLAAN